jgi:hypothetical protein
MINMVADFGGSESAAGPDSANSVGCNRQQRNDRVMTGIPGVAALALLWAAALYRTWRLPKGSRSPQRMALWLAIVALALAATAFYPAGYQALDRTTGVPNLAELVGHSLILIAAWQAHAILIFLIYPRSAARWQTGVRGGLVAASVTLMAAFFVLAPVDQEAPQTFTAVYAGAPYIVPYWVTFLVVVNLLLGDMVRLVARYANRSPNEHLRLGLHLIAVGGSFAVAYWCYWSAYLVFRLTRLSIPSDLSTAGRACLLAALVFCVLGSTVPAVGPRIGLPTPYTWLASMRDYRQLYPLWRALVAAAPEIVLNRPPPIVIDVRFWLNRRIIEIEDGLRIYGRNPPHTQPEPQPSHRPKWHARMPTPIEEDRGRYRCRSHGRRWTARHDQHAGHDPTGGAGQAARARNHHSLTVYDRCVLLHSQPDARQAYSDRPGRSSFTSCILRSLAGRRQR